MGLRCHIAYLVHALVQGARPQLTPGMCILLGSDLNPSSPVRITGTLSGRLSCPTVWAMEPRLSDLLQPLRMDALHSYTNLNLS